MSLLTDVVNVNEESVGNVWSKISGLTVTGVVKIVVLVIVLIIVVKLLTKLFNRLIEKSKLDKTLHGFLRTTVKIVLYFIAIMVLAGSLNIDVTSLIAVFSVAGLALSLALQGALANVAGGLVILITKPFRVGDYVQIGANEGFVEDINMTHTHLTTHEHLAIYIPNSTVTASNVVNYSTEGRRRVDYVICADYDCAIDDVKASLSEAILAVPQLSETEEVFTRVSGYKDNGVEYTVRAWCKNEDYWDAYFGVIESIKNTFDRNGIKMSYPNINVHVNQN